MSRASSKASVVLFGAGRVGTAAAVLLKRAGYAIVGVGPPDRASTSSAVRLLEVDPTHPAPYSKSDVVLLGVPDDNIEAASRDLAPQLAPDTLVVHFAGALGTAILDEVGAVGAIPCALHPVQSCPDIDTAVRRLPTSAWGITCPPEARRRAEQLVTDMGGHPVAVAEGDRALWHAAAATVANGTSALLAAGESMLAAIDIPDPQSVLGPLAAGTVTNAMELGDAVTGLTGPVARGDLATIEKHLNALNARAPGLVVRYRHTALLTLTTALDAGRLDQATAQKVRTLLERW